MCSKRIDKKCVLDTHSLLQCMVPVVDPGFPPGKGANSPGEGVGAPTYDFADFSQKLHEIERIRTPRGVPCAAP